MQHYLDGAVRKVKSLDDLVPGNVLRMLQPSAPGRIPPFSDCLIVSVNQDEVILARPNAYMENGNAKVRMEEFPIPIHRIIKPEYSDYWGLVLLASEKPYSMTY